eukprot:scaffold2365_cov77-Skeletonema_dohrnii-CCMP3373.AAC.27
MLRKWKFKQINGHERRKNAPHPHEAREQPHQRRTMENVVNSNTIATANTQAGGTTGLKKKKSSKSKKKKSSTRPKLRPTALPSVDEDNLERDGLGYGDILVVPPPTPRDKLFSDLHRLEQDITTLPKFSDEWFGVKAELAVVQMKLDDWDNSTPTAKGRVEAPVVTTNAAYQDIIKHISNEEEEVQPVVNKQKKNKKSSRKKIRPKLTPQSVEKREEGDEEEGLGFNDILLTKKHSNKAPVVVVDEQTTLLVDDGGGSTVVAPQPQSNVVGDWLIRGVIGTLFCFVMFKIPIIHSIQELSDSRQRMFRLVIARIEDWVQIAAVKMIMALDSTSSLMICMDGGRHAVAINGELTAQQEWL